MSPATILAPLSLGHGRVSSQSTWPMVFAASHTSNALASDERQPRKTIALGQSAVGENSYSLHRWLDQEYSQEPWSPIGPGSSVQELFVGSGTSNIFLAITEFELQARL